MFLARLISLKTNYASHSKMNHDPISVGHNAQGSETLAISGEDFIRELLNTNETYFRCFYASVNLCEIRVTPIMVGRMQFALLRERLDPANDNRRIQVRQHSRVNRGLRRLGHDPQSKPGLTSTAVADAVAQDIVDTIDVYAWAAQGFTWTTRNPCKAR